MFFWNFHVFGFYRERKLLRLTNKKRIPLSLNLKRFSLESISSHGSIDMALWLGPLRDWKERLTYGKASDRKVWHNTDPGSIPRCGNAVFVFCFLFPPEIAFGAYSLTVYVQFPVCNRMLQHLCARSKSQTLAAIPFIVFTHEMGSAALATAIALLPETFNNDKRL